jgi:predicted ferric reductase
MVDTPATSEYLMKSSTRMALAAMVIIVIVALFIGALTIPFSFESPSMFYKFGWKKTLLRSGKMVGLSAAICLLLQLPLAARVKWLDRIFSLPVLNTVHRYSAYGIITLVILHPIAVFIPDGIPMIPFEIRYWPEWAGAALFMVIGLQFGLTGCNSV